MMNVKKFAVIYLPSEKIYSEVPVSWITKDETQCWWPKSVNATSYMVRGEPPNVKTWELHAIEIETFCSTLESARRRAEDPTYLTSNEDFEETGRGRRKKKHIVRSSSEESITPPPSLSGCQPNKKYPDTKETTVAQINHTEAEPEINPAIDTEVSNTQVNEIISDAQDIESMPIIIEDNGTMNIDLERSIERLTRICLEMQKSIQSLHKTMKTLHMKNGNLEVDNYMKNLQEKLPLKTLEELVLFDDHLVDVENKRSFISYMKSVGGRDLKDNVNRCLALIYTNNLSRSCSLQGKRGNFKLGETYTMKLFIDIMVSLHKTNISEVQTHISEWFRLAKQRYLREK